VAPVGRGSGDALGSALVKRALSGPRLSRQDAEGADVAANGCVQCDRQGMGPALSGWTAPKAAQTGDTSGGRGRAPESGLAWHGLARFIWRAASKAPTPGIGNGGC
jgi:hypothetical protein